MLIKHGSQREFTEQISFITLAVTVNQDLSWKSDI
jgi:hypothetical protein